MTCFDKHLAAWFLAILVFIPMAHASVADGRSTAQPSPTPHERLAAAFALDAAGHPAAAIAAAQALIESHTLTPLDEGRALDLEGMSYLDMEQPDNALHVLEAAEQRLTPSDPADTAAVLDNMGRAYVEKQDYTSAERLYEQAFRIDEEIGNHAGMARVANNRAGIALNERKNSRAKKYLEFAEREAKLAGGLDGEDQAAMASMEGWLAENEEDAPAALRDYTRALQLWRARYGDHDPQTALGMVLMGRARVAVGDVQGGERQLREGLTETAATTGRDSQRYLAAELAYARVLLQMGDTMQANTMRMDAEAKLGAAGQRRCNGCTISVLALH